MSKSKTNKLMSQDKVREMGYKGVVSPKYYCQSRTPQYYTSFAVNLALMNVGIAWSWTATAIPDININSEFGPLTQIQESWITSIVMLGSIVVCPISGFFMKYFGLRGSMLALTLPLLSGWLLIICSKNFWMLLTGRFITGFGAGGISVAVPVFMAEVTEVEIRGRLGSGFNVLGSCGQLFIFIVGSYVSWKWQAFACGIIPIIFHALLMFVPECPISLIQQNKIEAAKKSLAWFRNAPTVDLIQDEFDSILETCQIRKVETRGFSVKQYFTASVLRPTSICVALVFFIQSTGVVPIFAHMVEIFKTAGVENSYLETVLIGITQVVIAILAAVLVDRIGRRILLMLSAVFMCIALTVLGTYLFYQDTAAKSLNWLPLACLILFITAFSIGFGPIPWIIIGEIIPTKAKEFSTPIVAISSRFFTFVIVFLFSDIISLIGDYGCYWLFALNCVIAFLYVYFYVEETSGKSLGQIHTSFENYDDKC